MGLFNRVLLTLFSLALAVLFGVLLMVAVIPWTTPIQFIQDVLANKDQRLIFGVISALFLVISVKFLLTSITLKQPSKNTVVQENKYGQIKISLNAIENLVRRMVSQVKGIRDVKVKVREFPEGVSIYIQAIVSPDIQIPIISEEIQKIVREKVYETTGVTVLDVRILVDNISTDIKSRVE